MMRDGTKNNWGEKKANFRKGGQGRFPWGGDTSTKSKGWEKPTIYGPKKTFRRRKCMKETWGGKGLLGMFEHQESSPKFVGTWGKVQWKEKSGQRACRAYWPRSGVCVLSCQLWKGSRMFQVEEWLDPLNKCKSHSPQGQLQEEHWNPEKNFLAKTGWHQSL